MSLYYQDDFVTLYHGDCLSDHREWLDADVLVTDPPYGVAYESNMNRNKRNAKMGRGIASDSTPEIRDLALLQWGDRPSISFGRCPWGRSEEEIYVSGTGFAGKRGGNVIRVQMLMSADSNRPDHPTPKPIPLMERLIEKCPAGVIADPFAGSGSTLVAAKNLGRKVVGVELEERYCEIIARRCAQEVLDFGVSV